MSDRKENGSITVEAALFIPMFLFAFMCIFSLISCVRAQVLIQYSVDQAAKEVAEYSYILEKTGVLDAYKGLNTKSEEFSKQMEDIKSNLEVIENTAKSVTNGQGTIQDVADAGKAGKATYDQLKEYKKNPKEFCERCSNYVKNGAWNKLASYMTGVVAKSCVKQQASVASGRTGCRRISGKTGSFQYEIQQSSWCAKGTNDIKIVVDYDIKTEFPFFDLGTRHYRVCASTRVWAGS